VENLPVPPSLSSRRRSSAASQTLADQFRPLIAIHDTVRDRAPSAVDVDAARKRIRSGRYGFEPAELLQHAGDLTRAFQRTAAAFERVGAASASQLHALRSKPHDVSALLLSWVHGDSMPRNPAQRLARHVAAVVGNAVLSRAAEDVADGFSFAAWKRSHCPCCGGSPDLALATDKRRSLICWRCDTVWRTPQLGCLGCGADSPPTLVRVASPYGYELTICNSCGRYLKERRGAPAHSLIVERALTAGLDEAAEQRGLRV
jgi:formate dehydrogenase maturation protein FdhE